MEASKRNKLETKKGGDDNDNDEGVEKGPSFCAVDQSAITGESLAVDKYLGDVAYYTCGVKRGKVTHHLLIIKLLFTIILHAVLRRRNMPRKILVCRSNCNPCHE